MSDEPSERADEGEAHGTTAGPSVDPDRIQDVLSLDHVYDALGHPRRRYLCYTLLEDDEWTLSDLATKVAAWEHEVGPEAVDADLRERTYLSLWHAHVPKLVAAGVVEFDREAETITPGPNADQVLAALRGMGATVDADQEAHARRTEPEPWRERERERGHDDA